LDNVRFTPAIFAKNLPNAVHVLVGEADFGLIDATFDATEFDAIPSTPDGKEPLRFQVFLDAVEYLLYPV
jgi:hypothetical protein